MTVSHGAFNGAESYAFMSNGNGDIALFNSNRAERRASWSRITTDGNFCSVCGIDNRVFANIWTPEGDLQLCEFLALDNQIGLDRYLSASAVNGANVTATPYAIGNTVDVLSADGLTYYGQFTLVDIGAGVSGFVWPYANANIVFGKAFTAEIVTNPIDVTAGNGPTTGDVRGISSAIIDFRDSHSARVNGRPSGVSAGYSGKKEIRVLGYGRDPQVSITQDEPLPLQVNGIVAELIV
jgi:hypothetical protein